MREVNLKKKIIRYASLSPAFLDSRIEVSVTTRMRVVGYAVQYKRGI
jgi:hypothetical protein